MNDEKVSADEVHYISHNEKNANDVSPPDLAEEAGRRGSVALNIVENPLKVSISHALRLSLRCRIRAHALTLHSAVLLPKSSPMRAHTLKAMAWPSIPTCSLRLPLLRVTRSDSRLSTRSLMKSVLPSFMSAITNGMDLRCFGTRSHYALLVLPPRVGIRQAPTEPTCHSRKSLVSILLREANGLLVWSMRSFSSLLD